MSFQKHFKSLIFLQKHWLECFMHAFEYFLLIKFNSNYFICFHNILQMASCENIFLNFKLKH
jgi:hypothetical protein